MTAQFDTARLVAIPLTPVHVGGGEDEVARPESYRVSEDRTRIDLFAVGDVLARTSHQWSVGGG